MFDFIFPVILRLVFVDERSTGMLAGGTAVLEPSRTSCHSAVRVMFWSGYQRHPHLAGVPSRLALPAGLARPGTGDGMILVTGARGPSAAAYTAPWPLPTTNQDVHQESPLPRYRLPIGVTGAAKPSSVCIRSNPPRSHMTNTAFSRPGDGPPARGGDIT
jgi:hypothetical protein